MVAPITPAEAKKKWDERPIPDSVIQSVNELIVENWYENPNNSGLGFARVDKDDLIARILGKDQSLSKEMIYARHYLDVEPIYRKIGWVVQWTNDSDSCPPQQYFTFTYKRSNVDPY